MNQGLRGFPGPVPGGGGGVVLGAVYASNTVSVSQPASTFTPITDLSLSFQLSARGLVAVDIFGSYLRGGNWQSRVALFDGSTRIWPGAAVAAVNADAAFPANAAEVNLRFLANRALVSLDAGLHTITVRVSPRDNIGTDTWYERGMVATLVG